MHKFVKFFAIFISLSFLFNLVPLRVLADVGEAPQEGGGIIPGDKTEDIEMASEKVVFDIKENAAGSPFYTDENSLEWAKHYAEVSADFEMKNNSSADVTMDLMFPIPANEVDLEYFNENSKYNPSLNFVVTVDDESVDYEYKVYDMTVFMGEPNYEDEEVIAIVFSVTFPANETTMINVSFDQRLVYEPKSMYGTFNYIMETGSHWSGKIGSGQVIFQFPGNISESMFSTYNDFFEIDEDMLVWNFTNLEPTANQNIKVSYAPSLMDVWESKETYVEDISSFGDSEFVFSDDNTPDGYFFGYAYRLEGNATFLLKDMEEGAADGWFAESSGGKNPWVMLDFDAIYEVDSMDILSSIAMEAYSDTGDTDTFYDVFERPKQVKLTYSDGTSEVVDLTDSKDEIQNVEIDLVETSSVKIEILDAYPTFNGESKVLGIARVAFGVGEKVGEKEVEKDVDREVNLLPQVTDDRGELEKFWDKNKLGIVLLGGSGVLLLGGIIVAIIRKKSGKTAKNVEVREEAAKEKVEKPEKEQNSGNEEVPSGDEDKVK